MLAARRCLLLAVFVLTIGFAAGCTQSGQWTLSRLLANPDYDDGTERVEPWVEQAGSEGRAGRSVEEQVDPLNLREVFMSDKARSIEKNLGIE